MTLLRGDRAAAPRTLVEIFQDTVDRHPDAPAVDNGAEVLTYEEFGDAAEDVAAALNALGVGRGDRVGVRISSGTVELYVAIMGILLAGAAYVPVDADDPDERARTVFDEADVAAVIGESVSVTTQRSDARPGRGRAADAGGRRLGDLHVRLDRDPQGRGGEPPLCGRLRGRGGQAVPAGRSRWAWGTG